LKNTLAILVDWPRSVSDRLSLCNNQQPGWEIQETKMVSISKHRKIAPVDYNRRAFNELSEASALLGKQKLPPSPGDLAQAHEAEQKDPQRVGQVIDILA
jgi:hypothetical protein